MNQNLCSPYRPAGASSSLSQCLSFIAVVTLWATTVQAASSRVVITPAAGFTITWDGNNGAFFSGAAGAGPAANIALASQGTVAFGSSEYGIVHFIANINNGLYGNNHSWLPNLSEASPFIGLSFAASVDVSRIAWSRDNGNTVADACGGTCVDRCAGAYRLQYTTVAPVDLRTPETGDASTGWADIGTVEYLPGTDDVFFSAYLRHRFEVAQGGVPITATGLRIKTAPGNAIDEIEVNPEPDPSFIEITPASGYSVTWDGNEGKLNTPTIPAPVPVNDASRSRGAVAFGSSEFGGGGAHLIANVNDGLYGNAHSWISDFTLPDPNPSIGIRFGTALVLHSIAWGRDNGDASDPCAGGACVDRTLGVYTLQVTTVPNPDAATPEACGPYPGLGWVTIATLNYKGDSPVFFNSFLRHRFNVAQDGQPLVATGIRIKVPNNGTDIDEIEVNANQALEGGAIVIASAPGASINWDGNDGQFGDGVAPPANRALATEGTVAFTSSDLGPALGIAYHLAINLNDGLYGNSHSWIPNFVAGDPNPFVGLNFNGSVAITNIAWGRDNTGVFGDRAVGAYTLQYTTVAAPGAATTETGDPGTGWASLGTVTYTGSAVGFASYLRHRFDISSGGQPVEATSIRIKVPNGTDAASSTDIDEIEVNTAAAPPAPLPPVGISPSLGYAFVWDGSNGDFLDAGPNPMAPLNRALPSEGTVAFTSSDLGTIWPTNYHLPFNLNDGLYGNSNSWISANGFGGTTDPSPFAGLNFGGMVLLTNIAWSRDNGNAAEPGCSAGTCTDRALGVYTVQVTAVDNPDATTPQTDDPSTGWATIGVVEYRYSRPPQFTSYLRHRFDVATSDGQPIPATGLLIRVSDGMTAIDEIEVNTLAGPQLSIARSGGEVIITWMGRGALEYATSVGGPWICVPGAISGYRETVGSDAMRLYRLHR
jgi:hypothetical protein